MPFRNILWQSALIALAICNATTEPAFAWGRNGHVQITAGAIPFLPEPLRDFFQANNTQISNQGGVEPPGNHFIDIDIYPEFAAGTFPHDLNTLIAKYVNSFVVSNGKAPWTYTNYVQTNTALMAAAKTNQDWLGMINSLAAQAHYIEDLHQPLHVTDNYDGQQSGNDGIHSRYETTMVNRHLTDLTFTPSTATYIPNILESVFDGIDVTYPHVAEIMAADTAAHAATGSTSSTAYYNSLWSQTGAFTKTQFQDAAQAVADGWYTAWVNAGSPIPNLGLAGDYNGDNIVDARDYIVWRNATATTSTSLVNDPTPGVVDATDYDYWRSHFGATIGSGFGAASTSVVPEPASWLLVLCGAPLGYCLRRHTRKAHANKTSGTKTSVQNHGPAFPGAKL